MPQSIIRTPREIYIELTGNCNLRCKYCYFFDNQDVNYIDLSTDDWINLFNELGEMHVMSVTLSGGEPFIRNDLKVLIDSIVQNRMRYSIVSNGSLITEEIAQHISLSGRCDSVQLSIDGSTAEIHDSARGSGSFKGVMRGLEILMRNGINTSVRYTIHKYNVDDLENGTKFFLEELGLRSFGTNSASYFGKAKENTDIMLTHSDRVKAMKILYSLNEKYDGRIKAAAGPLADALNFKNMQNAFNLKEPPFKGGGYLSGCGCYNTELAIRCDGAIIPCSMLPSIVLGYINTDRIIDVWHNSEKLNKLRQRSSIRLNSFKFCQECNFTDYCRGNCPGLAYNYLEEVNHPSPDGCYYQFIKHSS